MNKQFKISLNLLFHGASRTSKKIIADLSNWRQVYDDLNKDKPFKPSQSYPIGERIYYNKLVLALADLKITDEEAKELDDIKKFFSLADTDIQEIKADLNRQAVTKLAAEKFSDKVFTEEEKKEVFALANFLQLNEATVNSITQKLSMATFQTVLSAATQDKKLSPKEEGQLQQLLKNLGFGDDVEKIGLSKSTLNDLIFFKLLWQAENGYLLPYPNPPISLQKSEECYMAYGATLLESKTVTAGYKHISHGFSIPVTKGIRYRAGTGYSMPVQETVTTKYPGNLFLTDRRIVFDGGNASFTISFSKLISFHPYTDGIGFTVSGWVYVLKFSSRPNKQLTVNREVDLFCSALASCIRYYSNEDDPIYQQAVKDVKENEPLIKFINDPN